MGFLEDGMKWHVPHRKLWIEEWRLENGAGD